MKDYIKDTEFKNMMVYLVSFPPQPGQSEHEGTQVLLALILQTIT